MKKTVNMILKALAVAMGVAVVVLSILNAVDTRSCTIMLGIGLACIGLCLLSETDDKDVDESSGKKQV